jgi:6-phosphogluconolactonase (cycloisomerase 2 family)
MPRHIGVCRRSRAAVVTGLAGLALLAGAAAPTRAQTVIVGNDEKVILDDAGKQTYHPPGRDTIEFLSLANPAEPKSTAVVPLMNSLLGPPTNLAVHPNGEIALIANSMEWQQEGTAWKPVPDTKLHVLDLKASPPKVIQTVTVGRQPSGLSISAKGDLALVTNRADNSISVVGISGADIKVLDTIAMGDTVAHVAIAPDGRRALAIKPTVNKAALIEIDGQKVTYRKYDMPVGVFPYNVDITPDGKLALSANNGAAGSSDGNVDTVSVIDLEQNPPRVVDHVVVGDAPEGLAISPKGNLAAAILLGGSGGDKKAFYYRPAGALAVLKIDGKTVTKVGEVALGGLPEGVVFSADGQYVYVGNFIDGDLSILKVEGDKVTDTGKRLKLAGHPASMRASAK